MVSVGFGMGPDQNGTSTQPENIQVITAAEYANPGILAGCEVSTGTDMRYKVAAGAVIIALDKSHYVKCAVDEQYTAPVTAPATGTRTDIIYVKQNLPTANGNNAVVVGVGATLPVNAQEIARYTVSAGATASNQFTRTGNTIYARPIGGMLGLLGDAVDMDTSEHTSELLTRGSVSIYVPTDRYCELSLASCVSTSDTNGNVFDETGSVVYKFYQDGNLIATWERPYNRYWDIKQYVRGVTMQAGRHTFSYTVQRRFVPSGASGKWKVRYGYTEKFPGDYFAITDRGVWKG